MKTNVILKSADRELFGIKIRQNTQGQFLSVTDLQNSYERARWTHKWSDKRISDIINTITTKERVYYILKERDLIKTGFSAFMEMADEHGLTTVLKGLGLYKTTGRGINKTVMTDPEIWILLALELNPMIYAKVTSWLRDTLVFERIDAGNEYKPMNAAIKGALGSPDYVKFAKALNVAVFGRHEVGIRNLAGASELKRMAEIERFVINAIDQKYIKTEEQILTAIKNYK